jgi:hypothetical protein
VQTPRKINLPGRHCQCGAARIGNSQRCEKCQARSSWRRHNCRRPRHADSRTSRVGVRSNAETPTRSQLAPEEH